MEGQIDSAHSSSLHSSDMRPTPSTSAGATSAFWTRPSTDKNPRIQVQVTNYGMRYAAIRRPIQNARENDYVRITTFVAPFTALIPPNTVLQRRQRHRAARRYQLLASISSPGAMATP